MRWTQLWAMISARSRIDAVGARGCPSPLHCNRKTVQRGARGARGAPATGRRAKPRRARPPRGAPREAPATGRQPAATRNPAAPVQFLGKPSMKARRTSAAWEVVAVPWKELQFPIVENIGYKKASLCLEVAAYLMVEGAEVDVTFSPPARRAKSGHAGCKWVFESRVMRLTDVSASCRKNWGSIR